MRLTDWGRQFGLDRRATWQMMKGGRLPGDLVVERVGHIYYVRIPEDEVPADKTFLYARVSSSDQSADLVRQAERLQRFAQSKGWPVDEMVMEAGSGLDGGRRKLLRVLAYPGGRGLCWSTGTVWPVSASRWSRPRWRGGEIVVVAYREVDDDLVRDMTEVMTSLCARLHGKRSARRRAERAVAAAEGADGHG